MAWTVEIHKRVQRQIAGLPSAVQKSLVALLRAIELQGPVRGDWPNYSKLAKNRHHCHIKKGHPTYVAIWDEIPGDHTRIAENDHVQIVEVVYAGTHEKARY